VKKLLWLVFSGTIVLAAPVYTNCGFKTEPYRDICESARKDGVSVQYINEFLLSEKARQRDFKSFELFSPKKITVHHANEKRANNALVRYVSVIAKHLEEYSDVYDFAEKKYHVNREIVAAILMKETRLGKIKPTHDAFVVFNTLLLETKPVSARDKGLVRMAEANIVRIIRYCFANNTPPDSCNFASSYAGAVGIPQFMPQNFNHIEGYKKTKGDLSDMEDAIVSTSRFLHYNADFTELIDWAKIPDMQQTEEAWYDYDFQNDNASFAYCCNTKSGKQFNCFACGKPELQYLQKYVKKIMRYNNSSHYAVGVIRLAYDAHQMLRSKQWQPDLTILSPVSLREELAKDMRQSMENHS
jgi:membrane-bound lytic murein transglycosylase B